MSSTSKGKQTTLLQTWGYEGNNSQFSQKATSKTTIEEAFKNDDFDDALLANAEEEIQVQRSRKSEAFRQVHSTNDLL